MTDTYASLISRGCPPSVDVAVILGSGLGGFTEGLDILASIPYSVISGFPHVTVAGHSGTLVFARSEGKTLLVFSGRFHHYEGHPFGSTVLPVELANAFGAKLLVVSNAAGGINVRYRVGDLMLIDDFMRIGFPVSEPGAPYATAFPDTGMLSLAEKTALTLQIPVRRGTYLYVKGPVYETPAEIRAYRSLGADAVGMSTMPELLQASRYGMRTLGITLVTNMATGVTGEKLAHADIQDVAERRKADFTRLVKAVIASA
jgi:purine-nucleoside phosphorylase